MVKQWLRIDPLDTLFFKGAEPMIAGQSHEVKTVFPPMPSTLIGAIRAAILGQRDLLEAFIRSDGPDASIRQDYPLLGTPDAPGLEILGPLYEIGDAKKGAEIFFPAPAHWFGDSEEIKEGETISVKAGRQIRRAIEELGMKGSVPWPLWVLNPETEMIKSLSGHLCNSRAFQEMERGSGRLIYRKTLSDADFSLPTILGPDALYHSEARVGIALDDARGTRRVRKGHLYATRHVRLESEVRLLVGLSEELASHYMDASGVLQLGGEQRMARYETLTEGVSLPRGKSSWGMALSPFPVQRLKTLGWQDLPRASGPLIRMGGWDMKKGFHKPMISYLPSGTVVDVGENTHLPFGFTHI